MGQRSDEIREDIEHTREDLSSSLDVLGGRASPRRAAQRSMSGVKGRVNSMRERVMGSPDSGGGPSSMSRAGEQARQVGDRASEAASTAAEQIREAPQELRQNVEGNPLAAGLIAFGAGLLVGSIVPPTSPEKRMASSAADTLQPAVEQAKSAAQEVKSGVQESARGAAEEVKEDAKGVAQDVKEQAKSATEDVKEQAKGSAEEMKGQAQGAAEETTSVARQR